MEISSLFLDNSVINDVTEATYGEISLAIVTTNESTQKGTINRRRPLIILVTKRWYAWCTLLSWWFFLSEQPSEGASKLPGDWGGGNEKSCPNSLTASPLIFVASRLRCSLTGLDRKKSRQLCRLDPMGCLKTHTLKSKSHWWYF